MTTTMQTVQEQIEGCLGRKELLEQAFDGITKLSEEHIRKIRLLIESMGY